jgi:hypothetical protein
MALVKTGDALAAPKLQPGAKFMQDGYGLVVGTLTFKVDKEGSSASFYRGAPCPIAAFSFCKMHKASVELGALNLDTWTAEYVGIGGGSSITNPNTSMANGLTAENITAHPNFFDQASGFSVGPIAGLPSDFGGAYDDSTLGPPVTVIAVAPSPKAGQAVPVPSSEGYNGACFETGTGGRFIGFVDPSVPELYGKTQYLAAATTYSGVIYAANVATVNTLLSYLNTASATASWGGVTLLPSWGSSGSGTIGRRNLLSQVNVEEYGTLYKIIYEIRYNPDGWAPLVYRNA